MAMLVMSIQALIPAEEKEEEKIATAKNEAEKRMKPECVKNGIHLTQTKKANNSF